MTSIGGHVTCRSMDVEMVKTQKIEQVATPNKIKLLLESEMRWSLGLDTSNNFVIRNEVVGVDSFVADNDTGLVSLLGGSGGGGGNSSNLSDLNDVESENVPHKALLYYDDLSNNFKFSSDISVNSLSVSSAIEANIIFSYDPIKMKFYGNLSHNFVENDYVVFDKNTITARDAFGGPQNIIMGDVSVNNIDANILYGNLIEADHVSTSLCSSRTFFCGNPIISNEYVRIDPSAIFFRNNIQLGSDESTSKFIVDPIRQHPNNLDIIGGSSTAGYDTLLVYDDTLTKEIQFSLYPKLYNADIKNLDASNVNVLGTLECGSIKYADSIAKVGFNKVGASGSDTVHTLASFKVENVSAGWNFGHIHLHYAIQQHENKLPQGGGEAHINISFQNGFSSFPNKHLNKINTDGHLHSVVFKVSLTSPNIIDITYQNSNNNVTSVAGVVELVVSSASITPI